MLRLDLHGAKSIEIKPQKLMSGNGNSWYSGTIVIKFHSEQEQEISFYGDHAHKGESFAHPVAVACTEEGIASAQEIEELRHRLAIAQEILNTDLEINNDA